MLFALPVLALFVAFLYLIILGAVLLARFVLGSGHRTDRVAAAAILGPMAFILPIFVLAWSDDPGRSPIELGTIFLVLLAVCCGLGWPVAHFATRRLDRLTQFDPQVFE